jgi:hypothetical protein
VFRETFFSLPPVSGDDSPLQFVKVDLADAWLYRALALNRAEIKQVSSDCVVMRIKEQIKARRSAKRTVHCRKILAGGELSETLTLNFDGVPITVVNSLNSVWVVAEKTTIEWVVKELYKDMSRILGADASNASSSAGDADGTTPRNDEHVIFKDDLEDDEEQLHYLELSKELKSSREPT